jgi:hypothetical protein
MSKAVSINLQTIEIVGIPETRISGQSNVAEYAGQLSELLKDAAVTAAAILPDFPALRAQPELVSCHSPRSPGLA